MTLYELKPRFQALLRPLVRRMCSVGITANQVTLASGGISVAIGLGVAAHAETRGLFLLIPTWFLLRMGLNAIDGMLAREFGQQSKLGAYLNELCDVVSDAALYAPFAFVAPFSALSVGLVVFASLLAEFAGVLGSTVGGERRYDGPMGKSDRALVFGALGIWVGTATMLPDWAAWAMPTLVVLIALTVLNRIRSGIRAPQAAAPGVQRHESGLGNRGSHEGAFRGNADASGFSEHDSVRPPTYTTASPDG